MVDRDDRDEAARVKYWNETYVRYWRARVAEANEAGSVTSGVVAGDAKASSDRAYVEAIALLGIGRSDAVLELGCGFGRSLPLLTAAARHVTAVDISEAMIAEARHATSAPNVTFHVSPSERLPIASGSIDVIVCFAAFDAMYQAEALAEMNRVSRVGARVLVTGKNDDFPDDDSAALDAEMGARAKQHPNYFTDVRGLLSALDRFGFEIRTQRFFRRRGDFARGDFVATLPERHYEYLLVLGKVAECDAGALPSISVKFSKTYERREHAGAAAGRRGRDARR